MIQARLRDYFSTELFNVNVEEYFETFLDGFIKKFMLISAKGSSGRKFQDSRFEVVKSQFDMPYHIHIINGLLPALKLLEERFKKEGWLNKEKSALYLRILITGFTFHDINKLTNVELSESIEQHLVPLCEELQLEKFFSDWKQWIEEIKFIALGVEQRTKIYAHQKDVKEFDFLNTVLAEHCHFADSVASMDEFGSTAEFYNQLLNRRLDEKPLSTQWSLSFVEVQKNLFTLLSQKLLFAAKDFVKNIRKEVIVFSLRNGFVYIGEPLTRQEIHEIKVQFKGNLSDVVKSALLDYQECKLGFLENLAEENDSENNQKYYQQIKSGLGQILKAGFANSGAGSEKIKPFAISNYASQIKGENIKPPEIEKLETFIDKNELPLKLVPQRTRDGKVQNYFLRLSKEWDELDESDKSFLRLFALEKIKLLSSKMFPKWKSKESLAGYSTATERTVKAIQSAMQKRQEAETEGMTIDNLLKDLWDEVIGILATSSLIKTVNTKELDDFADCYLSGNFDQDIERIFDSIGEIPEKKNMCLFTGRVAKTKYGSNRAFGISALNFNNRSLNTLRSKDNQISSLFLHENELRLKELPRGFYTRRLTPADTSDIERRMFLDASRANTIIYYDFGEYFVDVATYPLLSAMGKALSYDCRDLHGLTLIFTDRAYDFNFYGMNFNQVKDDVESNFYFIYQMLNLIKKTGFRIFVTSILTPYHPHKEMFVFENCMPFVKKLGWDKIRIDEIDRCLADMKLFLLLNAKKLVSNVLNYAEDQRHLFTAFAQLDEENKQKARNEFLRFINSHKGDLKMSVMNVLAQIAIEMIRPKSGSTSQESWIIRDALKVLKDCSKEQRDKETTIEQIAGELRKTLKGKDYADLSKCEPFAELLYERLFEGEWKSRFPQPNRLRNWINQFAFLYTDKGFTENRKQKVRGIVRKMRDDNKDFSENAVIQYLIDENKKLEKYADEYRQAFQEVIGEYKQ